MMIINHGAHALVHAKARRPSIEIRTSYRRPIELKLPAFGVDSEFRPNVRSFFENYGQDTVIINGIDLETV